MVDCPMHIMKQDEGGLPPAGSTSTLSALAATAKNIGTRRIAAMASGVDAGSSGKRRDEDKIFITSVGEVEGDVDLSVAVTVLQDCLVWARTATLAAAGAALRVRTGRSYLVGEPYYS